MFHFKEPYPKDKVLEQVKHVKLAEAHARKVRASRRSIKKCTEKSCASYLEVLTKILQLYRNK